jgi:hypothetical protein
MFGNVASTRNRPVKLLIATVNFSGKIIAGADLGDNVLADVAKGLQQ